MMRISFWGDCKIDDLSKVNLQEETKEFLKSCDFNAINFEAPIHSNSTRIKKSGPSISQHAETPTWLKKHGYNIVSLANNHIMDFGKEGLQKTVAQFNNALLVGAGNWEDAYKVGIIEKYGLKVGFLALTHHEFGVLSDEYDKKNTEGAAWICHPKIPSIIMNAKNHLDFLFVLPHAGIENIDVPLPEWRSVYKSFIDSGADAVIASHPHVPQGWETYNNKPIFYSLGNFCFQKNELSDKRPYWNDSLCVVLTLIDKNRVEYEVRNVTYKNDGIKFRYDSEIISHTNEINSYLNDDIKYAEAFNKYCSELFKNYINYFSAGGFHSFLDINYKSLKKIVGILTGRYKNKPENIINNIRCESHRWAFLRALKSQINIM